MKKKKIANLIMVAIILAISAAGLLGVGYILGWFDVDDGSCAMLSDVRGIVNIEREGVSYSAEKDILLRSGDQLSCNPGATAVVQTADGYFVLSNSAQLQVRDAAADHFSADITAGEVFINTASSSTSFAFEGNTAEISNAVALLSVRSGAQTISVFSGSVGEAQAGERLDWSNGEMKVGKLLIQSLNAFAINEIRSANQTSTLCFTNEELDRLEANRWAEKQAQIQGNTTPESDTSKPEGNTSKEDEDTSKPEDDAGKPNDDTSDTEDNADKPDNGTSDPKDDADKPDDGTSDPKDDTAKPEYAGYCTISIYCNTILDNWDELDPAKAGYVPGDGVILPQVTVGFNEGETVFEVLNRVCAEYEIQIEYSWTPMYNSYYIEGINHLYEFDCGFESGWMYKVNGWFPNYGCSSYELQGDETIVWCYTCKGLGADVGAPEMG